MAGFRELLIWNKGIELSTEIYSITINFPKEEKYGIVSQLRRAATSVPSNIAEGWSRNSDRSFRYFLNVSKGSLSEIITFLVIAEKLKFICPEDSRRLQSDAEKLSRMIYGMQKRLTSDITDQETSYSPNEQKEKNKYDH